MSPGHASSIGRVRLEVAAQACETLALSPAARQRLASGLGASERTLRRALVRRRCGQPVLRRRGRRATPVDRAVRQDVIAALLRLGKHASVAVLRGLFRAVPYRTLARMKQRFVRIRRRRYGWVLRRLVWLRAGSVWATDFTKPKAALERGATHLLLVRDLASGAQLAAAPCTGEKGVTVRAVLCALFVILGAPLLLKHDNGPAFTARDTQALLAAARVAVLRSPPYLPSYNGSCERAGGCLKERASHAALVAGHPGRWTDAVILTALLQANETARPHGPTRPTPGEAFRQRRPVTPSEREAFAHTRAQATVRLLHTHSTLRGTIPTCAERAAIDRAATQHALCAHGYLQLRRGRLSTRIPLRRPDSIA